MVADSDFPERTTAFEHVSTAEQSCVAFGLVRRVTADLSRRAIAALENDATTLGQMRRIRADLAWWDAERLELEGLIAEELGW